MESHMCMLQPTQTLSSKGDGGSLKIDRTPIFIQINALYFSRGRPCLKVEGAFPQPRDLLGAELFEHLQNEG